MPGPNHVTPGGPAVTVPLSNTVTMIKISVGPMDNNAYLIRGRTGSVLIDAANDPDRLLQLIGDQPPEVIVTTHRHQDHWQGLAAVAEATGAQLVCGRPDADAIATGAWVDNVTGVWDGDVVALGEETLEVIGLVGHTPGSITLVYRGAGGVDHLFTGDSLFPGGPGKTRSTEAFTSLMDDLETKIFANFGDAAEVHPGHGDDTTLGAERPQLGAWRERGW